MAYKWMMSSLSEAEKNIQVVWNQRLEQYNIFIQVESNYFFFTNINGNLKHLNKTTRVQKSKNFLKCATN